MVQATKNTHLHLLIFNLIKKGMTIRKLYGILRLTAALKKEEISKE